MYCSTFGGILANCCPAGLAVPLPTTVMLWLARLGAGPGTYLPASNSSGTAAVPPQQAAAGWMVSMARGLGTALGVAVVTLTVHASVRPGHAGSGAGWGGR